MVDEKEASSARFRSQDWLDLSTKTKEGTPCPAVLCSYTLFGLNLDVDTPY